MQRWSTLAAPGFLRHQWLSMNDKPHQRSTAGTSPRVGRSKTVDLIAEMSAATALEPPHLPEDRREEILTRRCNDPQFDDVHRNEQVRDAVLHAMAFASIDSRSSFSKTLGYVLKYVCWSFQLGRPLELERLFDEDQISEFAASYFRQRLAADSRTPNDVVNRLLRVARTIPGTGVSQGPVAHSRKTVAPPIGDKQRTDYEAALAALPANKSSVRARVVWGLAAGAGGNGGEISRLNYSDITERWGVTGVNFRPTRHCARRFVPIQTEYLPWVLSGRESHSPESAIISEGLRKRVSDAVFGCLPINGHELPNIGALVSLYRSRLLLAEIPFSLIMNLCGLHTSHSLTDLLPYLPEPDEQDLQRWAQKLGAET